MYQVGTKKEMDLLSVELYSNSDTLNPRIASHTVFSYFNYDAVLLVL